jgi:hypothetical protein
VDYLLSVPTRHSLQQPRQEADPRKIAGAESFACINSAQESHEFARKEGHPSAEQSGKRSHCGVQPARALKVKSLKIPGIPAVGFCHAVLILRRIDSRDLGSLAQTAA